MPRTYKRQSSDYERIEDDGYDGYDGYSHKRTRNRKKEDPNNNINWFLIIFPFILTLVGLITILEEIIQETDYQKATGIDVNVFDAMKASVGLDINSDKSTTDDGTKTDDKKQ